MSLTLLEPKPLNEHHQTQDFFSGESSLDDWLKRKALANQKLGASRTFVCADEAGRVYGFYALAAGALAHAEASSNIRRNMPDPIPVMVLGRLAVDKQAQGFKLGSSLLKDAVLRCKAVAENVGVRALLVHALNENAKSFYQKYGFKESPVDSMMLFIRLF